jgi:hypothetical protein
MEALRQEDPSFSSRYQVFDAWKSAIGVEKARAALTSEIIAIAGRDHTLHEALIAIAPQRFGGGIDPKALGKWLSKHENNIAAGCKLAIDRSDKSRPRWFLDLVSR